MRERAEKRNPFSNEYGHPGNNEALNEARTQESLNRNPSIDVEVLSTGVSEPCNNLSRRPGHLFHNAFPYHRQIDGPTTQDHDPFLTVWPGRKAQNRLEGLATYYEGINPCHEFVIPMRFAAIRRQEV